MKYFIAILIMLTSMLSYGQHRGVVINKVESQHFTELHLVGKESNGFTQYRDIAVGGGGAVHFHLYDRMHVGIEGNVLFPRYFNSTYRHANNFEFSFALPMSVNLGGEYETEAVYVFIAPAVFYFDRKPEELTKQNNLTYGGQAGVFYRRAISKDFDFFIGANVFSKLTDSDLYGFDLKVGIALPLRTFR